MARKLKPSPHAWQNRIRRIIRERFVTEDAFAAHIGQTQSWLNGKLHNRRKVTYEDMEIIANGLDMKPSEVICTDEEVIIIRSDDSNLINQIREGAAEYIAADKKDALLEIKDLMTGRLERLKSNKQP